jgi:RNA polymerase sigma-70 factor (ECF subfamily)
MIKNIQEKAILSRAKQFDRQALEEIFDLYSPGIYRYAYHLLGDAELARDCMSETFIRLLNALQHGNGPDNYLAYLYRIAHNCY